jgi:hypothetical protein
VEVVNQELVRGEGEGVVRERQGTTGVVLKVDPVALGFCHQSRAVIMAVEEARSVIPMVAQCPAAAQVAAAREAHMAARVLQVRPILGEEVELWQGEDRASSS